MFWKLTLKAKAGCDKEVAALKTLLDAEGRVRVLDGWGYGVDEPQADEVATSPQFHSIMCAVGSLLKLNPSDFDAVLADMLFGSAERVVIPTHVGELEVCKS